MSSEASAAFRTESCITRLARFFPDATPVRIPVRVTGMDDDSEAVSEQTVIEYGTPREVLFVSRLPNNALRWAGTLVIQGGFASPETGGVELYVNKEHGFQVYLPKGYEVQGPNSGENVIAAPQGSAEGHRGGERQDGEQRRAQVQQEEDDHQGDDDGLLHQRVAQGGDGALDQAGAVVGHLGGDPGREAGLQLGQPLHHPADDVVLLDEPVPAFTRMLAGSTLNIIGWDDLQLTPKESEGIALLLSKAPQHRDLIPWMHEKSDGWAAGLILFIKALGREAIEPQTLPAMPPEKIFEYFASELFDKIDGETRDFLLKTSVLAKITPSVAGQLTGNLQAARILSELNRRNYFTEKRSQPGVTYQYHPLFREFLQSRASTAFSAEEIAAVRQSAAQMIATARTEATAILREARKNANAETTSPRAAADAEAALHAVERIRAAVASLGPPRIPLGVTISAGIAIHQGLFERTSFESLVARADAALYAAKKAGRDRVVLEPAPEPATPADVRYR